MRIDPEDFRRHYAILSDSALFAMNRAELIDAARSVYDQEVARRKAAREEADRQAEEKAHQYALGHGSAEARSEAVSQVMEQEEFAAADDLDFESGPPPEWLDEAACACSFSVESSPDLKHIQAVLRAAGIPSYITTNQIEPQGVIGRVRSEHAVMVPGALNMHAISILDRDIFNADQEADWRNTLAGLTDGELRMLNPDVFCAGLLDRAARLKKAYEDEMTQRHMR